MKCVGQRAVHIIFCSSNQDVGNPLGCHEEANSSGAGIHELAIYCEDVSGSVFTSQDVRQLCELGREFLTDSRVGEQLC